MTQNKELRIHKNELGLKDKGVQASQPNFFEEGHCLYYLGSLDDS